MYIKVLLLFASAVPTWGFVIVIFGIIYLIKDYKNGFALLTEERRATGIFGVLDIKENTVISSLKRHKRFGIYLSEKSQREDTQYYIDAMRTKTPSQDTKIRSLSGGNQQKVIIARWLLKDSDVFIFDEPTRGIDIGAKSEMYDLIEQLSENGKSVIIISSELSEILRISDRILVMCEGRITKEIPIGEANQENIMKFAMMRGSEKL